ncbi:hypothetical protein QYS46_30420 [Klebsiella michiganensis]|nr:hypothetical protein [Klebsiella michiganensis]
MPIISPATLPGGDAAHLSGLPVPAAGSTPQPERRSATGKKP